MSGVSSRRTGRRRSQFGVLATGLTVVAALSLSACGGEDAPPPNAVATGQAPSYYPADYAQVIETSKGEGGTLNIYSNTDQENWAPIFRDFQKKYPWVKKISANNLDKGPTLLGVRAILAVGFERIHRSNLVGMGVLPLQFLPGQDADTLGLTGEETYAIHGLTTINNRELPDTLTIEANTLTFEARVRLDTPREIDYYRHGGIMPYVLRGLLPSPERLRPRIH